ncbi:MerR family transcriptional regulator [Pseudarthrobacter enclensis]|jgi:DNA-binding transcriptional MerR regulator|uniref:MerR family transcriptional regulator n=1 Tax=Pseudarthrobacter enclensis TaxID=993070 RepID=A0A0V8ISE7_9MICC|nr:MerR family transcriptional regulator [Pseudarthrobacter enclensis]KSU77424.1 MerR family transcriptional regulator [Pseudarthrobacter enclensis]BCW18861.1 MerR family transcriptional regulator [Arthrobacter sp. NtRootA9]SCB88488.1 MerR family regulatory protein [Pseudarthrobacter enclensis]
MAQPDRRGPQVLNIGEVLAQLSADFPGMTASKIRFLEEKGLINPRRTPAGYRQYSDGDVERLRFVLALQRDQYLPLKVIKDYLDAIDRGERPENLPPGVVVSPRIVSDELAAELQNHGRRLSEDQLRTESGASVPLLKSLLDFGLISHSNGYFDEHALQVARACVQLESHGLEPRHLRPFQAAAEREFGLVERAVAPLASRKDSASQARAAEAAREISDLCLTLHRALVQDHISRMDI